MAEALLKIGVVSLRIVDGKKTQIIANAKFVAVNEKPDPWFPENLLFIWFLCQMLFHGLDPP